jgi:DNA-binding transcriptional ArsR family regulator
MNVDLQQMEESADRAIGLLKALGSRNRLMILCQLTDGERSVGELADALQVSGTAVSQHLALLRRDGLVRQRREAQTIYYDIASEEAARVIDLLYQMYCAPAESGGPDCRPPTPARSKADADA